ncbi:hypothetical protein FMEAI12_1850006 [Parafrankia sp. Ea1.12]|nr:hypothetical protein FMEAI12_1850006 [Parafrankia sp. Ea1.12]
MRTDRGAGDPRMHTWNPSDVDRDRADRDRYDSPDTFDLHGRPRRSDGRWPLAGAAAAVLGALGSFVLGWDPDEGITQAGTDAIYREAGEHGSVIRAGASLGFVAVAALIVFAAGFTRALGRRAPGAGQPRRAGDADGLRRGGRLPDLRLRPQARARRWGARRHRRQLLHAGRRRGVQRAGQPDAVRRLVGCRARRRCRRAGSGP